MERRRFLLLAAAAPARGADKPAPRSLRVAVWPPADAALDPKSIQANVDGKPSGILRALGPQDDLLILLVLDLTGDLSLVDPAREALTAELNKLPAKAWAGLLRSQDGLRVLVDPGPDRAALAAAIANLPIAGRAALLESIEPAAQLGSAILRKTPVRLAVLYVTDSNIFNYREDYTNPVINPSDHADLSRRFPEALVREKTAKLAGTLSALNVPVFAVHIVYLRDRLNEAYQTGLQQMTETTGGQAWFSRTPTEIPVNIEQAFARILSHWAVDVEMPDRPQKTFNVQLTAGDLPLPGRSRFTARRD
jgi:hypothetical protein